MEHYEMGTKVQSEICLLPGYYSMRDLNKDSSNYGWLLCHCDKPLASGNYYNGYFPRATTDTLTGCDKDVVKQTMLEHEATFKKQVYELHRLYQIQRDLMEETKRKELHRNQYIEGTSFCSRPSTSQITIDVRQRWHVPVNLADSFSTRAFVPGVDRIHSPAGAVTESNRQDGGYTPQAGGSSRDFVVLESRPTKVRRKNFDLQLPADEYLDSDESDKFSDEKGYRNCGHFTDRNCEIGPQVSLKLLVHDSEEERSQEETSRSEQSTRKKGVADLNHPVGMEETNAANDRDPLCQSSHPEANGFSILPVKTKSHSVTWCSMPNSNYNKKSMSTQMYSCLNSSKSLFMNVSMPGPPNGIIGEPWPSNSYSKSNLGFGLESPANNGLYHGSSSGIKEVLEQPVNLDSGGYCKLSNINDMKSVKDLRIGSMLSNGSSNKDKGPTFIETERKLDTTHEALPWLQARASCKNDKPVDSSVSTGGVLGDTQTSSTSKKDDGKWGRNGTITQNMTSVSCSSNFECRRGDCSCSKKILGIPIFEKSCTIENDSYSLTCSVSARRHSEDEVAENSCKIRVIDINLPCDLAAADLGEQIRIENHVEGVTDTKDVKFGCQIDLNLSVTDDEASVEPNQSSKLKMTAVIDLETPAVCEMEDDAIPATKDVETPLASTQSSEENAKQPQDELMIKAAEAIFAISSAVRSNESDHVVHMVNYRPKHSVKEPLVWFVDIVSSCVDNLEEMLDASFICKHSQCNEDESSEEFDIFESLTLRQAATKEEDYMPQSLVPEKFELEEPGPSLLPTRLRRGPARRGRQRRDFQRDILPGLASLSRHEVREDLQLFGGLMQATGHSWNLGLTRRNSNRSGCGRGRRRMTPSSSPPPAANSPLTPLTQQSNNVEMGLEDRNLTCWGKTTRRPRRQRCTAAAAGNPPIPLTQ